MVADNPLGFLSSIPVFSFLDIASSSLNVIEICRRRFINRLQLAILALSQVVELVIGETPPCVSFFQKSRTTCSSLLYKACPFFLSIFHICEAFRASVYDHLHNRYQLFGKIVAYVGQRTLSEKRFQFC